MQHSNHIVTISESMKEALIERGVSRDKITVVPNAVDVNNFKPGRKNKKLIKKLGIDKKRVIGYISNISLREGHETQVRAMPQVIE